MKHFNALLLNAMGWKNLTSNVELIFKKINNLKDQIILRIERLKLILITQLN